MSISRKEPPVTRIGPGRRSEDRQLMHEFRFPRNYARVETKTHKLANILSLISSMILVLACATGFGAWAYFLAMWLES